jgi:hypothetical protein
MMMETFTFVLTLLGATLETPGLTDWECNQRVMRAPAEAAHIGRPMIDAGCRREIAVAAGMRNG